MGSDIVNSINKLNDNGDLVISESVDGGGKTQTIKYGLIKLIGEKQERRVSLKTILDIDSARKAGFTGNIDIPEINMNVPISQIAMMRSETENVRTENSITSLPTANVILTLDFEISNKVRPKLLREQTPYYEAVVHYLERDGERQYYLELDKIKRLLKVEFDEDGYDYISQIYEYGVKK